MTRRLVKYVPLALCAMGVATLFLSGCRKDGDGTAVPPNAPASYMKDPEFRRTLEDAKAERDHLAATRHKLTERMKEMIDAQRAKMPKADHAAVKAELEKDPEWRDLYKKVSDLNTAIKENRQRATAYTGERLRAEKKSAKPLSKEELKEAVRPKPISK